MNFDPRKFWNENHLSLIKDRPVSEYARNKEKLFPRNSIICDLGGGDGTDSFYFIKKGHTVYLFDVSDSALTTAKDKIGKEGRGNNLITKQIDLSNYDSLADDNFFDIIYSRLSLHYFLPETLIRIYKSIYRSLKKGGAAYVAVKSPEDNVDMAYRNEISKEIIPGVFNENGQIKTRFTKSTYREILKEAGIKNFEIKHYREKFSGANSVKSGAKELLYIDIIIRK